MRSIFLPELLSLLSLLNVLARGAAFTIQSRSWDYRGHEIGYEVAESAATGDDSQPEGSSQTNGQTSILLLNGFGVGSFHQHRLIPNLISSDKLNGDDELVVYGIDYLGQGRSWPRDCDDGMSENEKGLRYSAEIWLDQIITFIEDVILPNQAATSGTVHIVGNSVGGHLAAHVANRRPDLVESLCLLNPTPVWGLNLPGWSGHLPAPEIPKAIGRFLFDQIRDLGTIDKYLEAAYSNPNAYDEDLMRQIRGCTLGKGGHAAFASILWSPPLGVSETEEGDFQECLTRLKCDVLLGFGADDPWCKPAFAKTMLEALNQRTPGKVHRYVEIDNCGHCPNHEAPQAVGQLVSTWVTAKSRKIEQLTLVEPSNRVFQEDWAKTTLTEKTAPEIELSFVDQLAVTFV